MFVSSGLKQEPTCCIVHLRYDDNEANSRILIDGKWLKQVGHTMGTWGMTDFPSIVPQPLMGFSTLLDLSSPRHFSFPLFVPPPYIMCSEGPRPVRNHGRSFFLSPDKYLPMPLLRNSSVWFDGQPTERGSLHAGLTAITASVNTLDIALHYYSPGDHWHLHPAHVVSNCGLVFSHPTQSGCIALHIRHHKLHHQ